jgi:hypothetical protein
LKNHKILYIGCLLKTLGHICGSKKYRHFEILANDHNK